MKDKPWSEEGERGVLGSVLLDTSLLGKLSIQPYHFFERRNQILWAALQEMYATGKVMDALMIGDTLKESNTLEAVGGYDRLVELQDYAVVPAHSEWYEQLVLNTARIRSEIDVIEAGLGVAYGGESCSDAVVSGLIGISDLSDEEKAMDKLAESFVDDCDRGQVGHFGWWCDDWTNYLGKMSSDLMIFHAPRSTGKTALMLQWIVNAHRAEKRTPLASIEMLKKELAPRFIAHIGQVTTFTMRIRGHITEDEKQKSSAAIKTIKALELCVRDKAMTIDDIRTWAVAEHRNGADAIFIDNLLSISNGNKDYQSKTIMYDEFIRKLRDLRDLLKIPIIILAHPNAEGQVAWSRDVENFADIILYMREVTDEGISIRNKQITKDYDMNGKHILAIFQKNRQGISPMASLQFNGDTQTFKHIRWET